jgi:hypothetical protein
MQQIHLANSHLIIDASIANDFFGEVSHVNLVYYPNRKTLLVAATTDELFKGLHKTSMAMLKLKNAKGDRSISIQEIVIDNDIDPADSALVYQADSAMKIITVYF